MSSFLPFFQVSVRRLQARSMNESSFESGSPLHSTACAGRASEAAARTQRIHKRLTDTNEPPPLLMASMPEMADAGKDHRNTALVGRGDHLIVAHTTPGLDDRDGAVLRDDVEPISERKE